MLYVFFFVVLLLSFTLTHTHAIFRRIALSFFFFSLYVNLITKFSHFHACACVKFKMQIMDLVHRKLDEKKYALAFNWLENDFICHFICASEPITIVIKQLKQKSNILTKSFQCGSQGRTTFYIYPSKIVFGKSILLISHSFSFVLFLTFSLWSETIKQCQLFYSWFYSTSFYECRRLMNILALKYITSIVAIAVIV